MKAIIVLALASLACSVPDLGEPPDTSENYTPSNKTTDKSTTAPAGSGSASAPTSDAPAVDSTGTGTGSTSPFAHRWRGTLATAAPTSFGGNGYCPYRITLKQIGVDLAADDTDQVVFATVTATAVEEVGASDCGAPYPPNTHHYALTSASVLPNGVTHLELAGASTNKPAATLVIEGNLSLPDPVLSLRWHRTDQPPPLDWKVNAQVPTTAQ